MLGRVPLRERSQPGFTHDTLPARPQKRGGGVGRGPLKQRAGVLLADGEGGLPATQQALCRVGFLEEGASMGLLSAQDGGGRGQSGRQWRVPVDPLRTPCHHF